MKLVEPIRDINKLNEILVALRKSGYRNYLLGLIGFNTGLRISDIRLLTAGDMRGRNGYKIIQKKTKKTKFLYLDGIKKEIDLWIENLSDDDFLFPSRKDRNLPITRVQAYRIISKAAEECGLTNIGTHSLRKTFGYHYYNRTKNIALLMQIFGHTSEAVTLRYIGINQDVEKESLEGFRLG